MTQLDAAAVAAIRSAATSAAVGILAAVALAGAGFAVAHQIPLPRAAPVAAPPKAPGPRPPDCPRPQHLGP